MMQAFAAALNNVMTDLAMLIVRDGEGASKFISINVSGAEDDASARRPALPLPIRRWSKQRSPVMPTGVAS